MTDEIINQAAKRFEARGCSLFQSLTDPNWFALEDGGDFAGWLEGKAGVMRELERVEKNEPKVDEKSAEARQ